MEIFEGFLESTWLGPAAWAALYVSDYFLTVACARLYGAQSTIAFEGSYEITPFFQADVNALRRISRRFVIALVASTAYLYRSLVRPRSFLTCTTACSERCC